MKKREQFSKLHSVSLNANKQGLVFYICRNYNNFSEPKRRILDETFEKAGGYYTAALKKFMTTSETAVKICIDEHIGSPSTLYITVRKLYETFPLHKFYR